MTRLLATTALALVLGLGGAAAQQAPSDESVNPPAAMPSEDPANPSMLPSEPSDAPAMNAEPSGPSEPIETAPDQSTEAPLTIAPKAESADKGDKGPSLAGSPQFLNEQQPNDWLASQLIGKSVVNAENESVGAINDLVTDSDGKLIAALIGVGGFLGLGEKDVAVSFEDLKLARDENNDITAMLNTSKDALAQAPDYKTLDEQEVVQGSVESDSEQAPGGY